MKAGSTIQALVKIAVPVAPGSPDGRVRGPEQADHGHTKRRRHVHGPIVVTDHQRSPLQHRSEEHTSELQSLAYLVCRLLLEKKKNENLARLYLRVELYYR